MAIGKKTGGRNFEKGNQARKGKKPGKKTSTIIRDFQRECGEEFTSTALTYLFRLTKKELATLASDAKTSQKLAPYQVWLINIMGVGARKGDVNTLGTLLDRVIGRPKFTFEHTGAEGSPLFSWADVAAAMERYQSESE